MSRRYLMCLRFVTDLRFSQERLRMRMRELLDSTFTQLTVLARTIARSCDDTHAMPYHMDCSLLDWWMGGDSRSQL